MLPLSELSIFGHLNLKCHHTLSQLNFESAPKNNVTPKPAVNCLLCMIGASTLAVKKLALKSRGERKDIEFSTKSLFYIKRRFTTKNGLTRDSTETT